MSIDISNPCWLLFILAAGVILNLANDARADSKPRVTRLLTEYRENPLGIDAVEPRFSWQFVQDGRNCRQSAFQIQIADDLQALLSGKANIWDLGKVESSKNIISLPLGPRLKSGTRYWWRVKVWDANDVESEFSEPAWFETALLDQSEWQGVWLAAPGGGNGYHSALSSKAEDVKWVQVDLGEPMEFSAVKLFPARPYNWREDVPGFGFPLRYRLEASNEPDFKEPTILVDKTAEDQPNPKEQPVEHKFDTVKARYVRLTATKLWMRQDGQRLLALAEMQVISPDGTDIAFGKQVKALDSIEDSGWSASQLTEGILRSAEEPKIAPLFRREFELPKPVKWARAYVTGLGYCELHLNGRKVGDRVLDPAYTVFDKRVLYSTYDVTEMLRQGRNAVGVILGKGWYSKSPRFILQLNIMFEDGTRTSIVTDSHWKRGNSPILENSLYHGEVYDARLEQPGWDAPGFDDSKWEPAETVPSPTQKLSAEVIQPIRVSETIKPKAVTSPKEGIWVYDFGQNFSGWCRLKVSGPAGTEVRLRYAEVLYDYGMVNQENLRSARATDRYILKGDGVEVYEPRFTYHGFRYVQLEGFPGEPDLDTLLGCVVRTDFPQRGSFECSNALINQIQHNSVWGYKTNWHSIPTDCPQRDERQGWMGDAGVAAEVGFYNFDMGAAFSKFLQDIQDQQGEDGRIPDTVPHVWGSNPGDPMWAAAYHVIVWDMYRHTGDQRLLEKHYENLKRYVDMLAKEAPDGILSRNNYGDWVGVVETPKDLISTGAFYYVADILRQIARKTGHFKDFREYSALCSKIADAFNAKFFHPESNTYGNGSQYSNAWPLYLGIVPKEHKKAVVDNLVHDIMVNHKGHLSVGFLGARYLPDVLCNEGHPDVAYTIVTQKDYPGWGYMIENGATTIWELWVYAVGNGMNSHNHPAFGSISAWFYRKIAGIAPKFEHGGFEYFYIKPFVMGDLTEAKASVETIRGTAASHWKRSQDKLTLDATVPANSCASVWVPKNGIKNPIVKESGVLVWKGGKFIPGADGIESAADEGDWVRFEVGSGKYSFELSSS
ncbi:MAG: family 78 glycoside hydrolase catalytic domain [Armatimonadota bacterium]|nr:family 78 glycoside hydrolase catalytic domain [Armatimonadota bacterium]